MSDILNTAVFIGHNECYGVSAQQVEQAIIALINKGVTVFMSGGQGGFDRLCAGCVHRLKKQYPHIVNCLVIPYLTFTVFDKDILLPPTKRGDVIAIRSAGAYGETMASTYNCRPLPASYTSEEFTFSNNSKL